MAKLLSFSCNQGFHGERVLPCSLGWRELAQTGSILGSSYAVFSLSRAGGLQETFPPALATRGLEVREQCLCAGESEGITCYRSPCLSNWPFIKIRRDSLGHGQPKTQKSQIRPEGSHDRKNCHHLAIQSPGAWMSFQTRAQSPEQGQTLAWDLWHSERQGTPSSTRAWNVHPASCLTKRGCPQRPDSCPWSPSQCARVPRGGPGSRGGALVLDTQSMASGFQQPSHTACIDPHCASPSGMAGSILPFEGRALWLG